MKTKYTARKENNMFIKSIFTFMLTCILCLAGHAACIASTVVLQWDPNTETDLNGYNVYYQENSSSQPFTGTTVSIPKSQTTATISGLDPAHAYFFAVTAFNTSSVESSYSNIVTVPELISPAISLSSPANNATVSGTVSINADATDNVGVSKVEIYVNGILQATDTSTPYVYSWNTSTLASGTYTLMAKAYDAADNVGQSANISAVVVNDTTAPTVSVTAPANNATVSGTVSITATAADNVGVSKVEFYENGVLLSATNVSPYSYNWNTTLLANGSYTLTAKSFDTTGNVGQSDNVTVTVSNGTTSPTISLTSPANGTTLTAPATIALAATATAGGSATITRVRFYNGTTLLKSDTTAPYTYTWSNVTPGTYTLTARVYNSLGVAVVSAPVTVTVVSNPLPTLSINTTSLATSTVNVVYNNAVAAIGGTPPYSWSATGLPTGLTINPGTGFISGTPANVVPFGVTFTSFPVTLTVTDSTTATATAVLNLRINQTAPAAPSGLAATATSPTRVVLTWTDNANNESGFNVQRATNPGFTTGLTSVYVSGVDRTTYADTTVVAGTTYYYRMRGQNYVAYSTTFSNTVSVTTTIPSITTTSLATGTVNVVYNNAVTAIGGTPPYSWSATGLPNGLTINPGTGVISGTLANVVPFGVTFTSFPVTLTVTDSTTATAAAVLNLRINQTAPAAPSGLAATATSPTRVVLSWTDNANNESGFNVQRATNPGFTTGLTSVYASGINRTTYTDTTAVAGTTYYYRLRGQNYVAYSTTFSNVATVTTP